ncbi:MAG: hypothetical protein R8K48_03550 [Gallionella sp.]
MNLITLESPILIENSVNVFDFTRHLRVNANRVMQRAISKAIWAEIE